MTNGELLITTFEKLLQYYPERKTYAMDAICKDLRERLVKVTKFFGFDSVDDCLRAHDFEPISGPAVYELRKDLGYTPGKEPEIVKAKVDYLIAQLDNHYPNHIIEGSLQKQHKSLGITLTGLYQWLGYQSAEAMLSAYGFE